MDRKKIQHFIGESQWDETPLRLEMVDRIAQQFGTDDGILILAPSAIPKPGYPFCSAGKDDDTPFDGSGLKMKTIKTRRQLNEAEFDSIMRVTEKDLLSISSRNLAPFTFG